MSFSRARVSRLAGSVMGRYLYEKKKKKRKRRGRIVETHDKDHSKVVEETEERYS